MAFTSIPLSGRGIIGLAVKNVVFNRKIMQNTADKVYRRVFSRFGAFTRRTARRGIKKGTSKSSSPTHPPKSWTGRLKGSKGSSVGIFFALDAGNRGVVIGPTKAIRARANNIPRALEYGGRVTIRPKKGKPGRTVSRHIQARPYMRPAFNENLGKLESIWKRSIV